MSMTRKDFLKLSLGLGAAAALVSGCGDDKGGGGSGGGGGTGGGGGGGAGTGGGAGAAGGAGGAGAGGMAGACTPAATIAANHGHVLMVPAADVTAAADKSYSIMGTATHNHTVMVTAANFATLKGRGTLTLTSSDSGGHNHMITVMCA